LKSTLSTALVGWALVFISAACGGADGEPSIGVSAPADARVLDATDVRDAGDSGAEVDSALDTTPAAISPNDAPAPPTCGSSAARYTLLSGADDGLVRDNVTGLVWMSESHGAGEPPQTQPLARMYCESLGMRLPTRDEAIELAANDARCAFARWSTWTSTAGTVAGEAWVIDYTGGATMQVADNFPSAVLCVRDAARD
jgi:hypothetical protein